jgi:hydroxymethylbilane synthase
VSSRLAAAGYETERIEIKTTGDLTPEVPLAHIGSRAVFTKQIDEALLDNRIDLAVHSLKDLPTQLPEGIAIAAISAREDPRDALVGRGSLRWDEIPRGGVIGTSSLRRRAQLLSSRADLAVVDIRGNIDTRLRKLDSHAEWTAILLAAAGLVRLGLAHRIGQRLPPVVMLPAPGQGALAVTIRADDNAVGKAARQAMHDQSTALAVAAERAFLRRLEGGCQVPIAAYAEQHRNGNSTLSLHGRVLSIRGERMIEGHAAGSLVDESASTELGISLAERLLHEGAGKILAEARKGLTPAVTEP